jgi:NADH-ubiquinone oxidoreductase chain 5
MLIGSLSLVGFPFLTGFYSKDVILEVAYAKYTLSGNFVYWLGILSALCTSYYSFRLLNLGFHGSSDFSHAWTNAFPRSLGTVHEAPVLMALPLVLLGFGSIFAGYFGKDMMIGLGTDFWSNALFVLPKNSVLLESEYIPQTQKFLPLICTFLGAGLAYIFNMSAVFTSYALKMTSLGKNIYSFLNQRWFIDKVYNDYLSQNALSFGYHISFKTLDKGSFEILGPSGIASTFLNITKYLSKLQSGMIYHYAVVMLLGLTLLITIISLWEFLEIFLDNRFYFIYLLSFLFYNYYSSSKV